MEGQECDDVWAVTVYSAKWFGIQYQSFKRIWCGQDRESVPCYSWPLTLIAPSLRCISLSICTNVVAWTCHHRSMPCTSSAIRKGSLLGKEVSSIRKGYCREHAVSTLRPLVLAGSRLRGTDFRRAWATTWPTQFLWFVERPPKETIGVKCLAEGVKGRFSCYGKVM